MTPRRKQRLTLIGLMLAGVGAAVGLTAFALQQDIELFRTPAEIAAGDFPPDVTLRIGGLVQAGSVTRTTGQLKVRFAVTDHAAVVPVVYEGILPDLFREGQGVVAKGRLSAAGVFQASEVLAKHDENYMPPEVAEAMQRQGMLNHRPGGPRAVADGD